MEAPQSGPAPSDRAESNVAIATLPTPAWLNDPSNILKVADFTENRLQYESGWVGQRMSWLVVSQSFLFAAFIATINLLGSKITPSVNDKAAIAEALELALIKHLLAWGIPGLAIVQAVAAYLAICAAKEVQNELTTQREEVHAALEKVPLLERFPLLGTRNRRDRIKNSYMFGAMASHIIPQSLILMWASILSCLVLGPAWETHPSWIYGCLVGQVLLLLIVLNAGKHWSMRKLAVLALALFAALAAAASIRHASPAAMRQVIGTPASNAKL